MAVSAMFSVSACNAIFSGLMCQAAGGKEILATAAITV